MALIVEDGSGLPNAESYASIAFATNYMASIGNTEWDALSLVIRENALRVATQYLDMTYALRWKGRKSKRPEDQALAWPRFCVLDQDGYTIGADSIPISLQRATVEAALRALTLDLTADISSSGLIKEYAIKVGPIMEKTVYAGGASQRTQFTKINYLLRDLLVPTFMERA